MGYVAHALYLLVRATGQDFDPPPVERWMSDLILLAQVEAEQEAKLLEEIEKERR